jgi:predicted component of type VI protein secretion system
MDELKETVETLIDLDEPEALLETLKRAAERQKGVQWARLAQALACAQDKYAELNPKLDPPNQSLDLADEAKPS